VAKKGNGNGAKLVEEAIEAAEEAGLRYVTDDRPGYTRKAKGDDFEYFDTEEKPIADEQRLLRVKRLAIPPAWTDVWICPSANGHIQATGRDARRRKQYLYHERWREIRDQNKYDRMIAFGKALPKIRRRVAKDLKLPGLPRNKVLATVVQLLERTSIRIGNEEYARENKSFGLTTMQDRHVEVKGAKLRFRFRGKSGKDHEVDVTDRRIAKIVSRLQDLPGQDLFKYCDDNDQIHDVKSQDVNEYLREITGEDFSAKDFRTLAGTVLTAVALNAQEKFENAKQAKKNISTAIKAVAQILGNTPAICRKCYVHPAIFESYLSRKSIEGVGSARCADRGRRSAASLPAENVDLRSSEAAVLKFLESRL
jgi:DNA topoisomerase I